MNKLNTFLISCSLFGMIAIHPRAAFATGLPSDGSVKTLTEAPAEISADNAADEKEKRGEEIYAKAELIWRKFNRNFHTASAAQNARLQNEAFEKFVTACTKYNIDEACEKLTYVKAVSAESSNTLPSDG